VTAPGTACARCAQPERKHGNNDSAWCCSAYQPAPTPTADCEFCTPEAQRECSTQPNGCTWLAALSLGERDDAAEVERLHAFVKAVEAPIVEIYGDGGPLPEGATHEDYIVDAVQAAVAMLDHAHSRADAAEERARTAEAEVERLRGPFPCCEHCADDVIHDVEPNQHTLPCTLCVSAEVKALGERIALAIVTHCQTHHTVLGEATADGPVCVACADAARIARETT
jgi:hypothetical protein